MRRAVLTFATLVALALIGVVLAQRWLVAGLDASGPHDSPVPIQIEPGLSQRAVLARLESAGVLREPRATGLWLRLYGSGRSFKAGNYELPAGASARSILEQLWSGRVVLESLTVIEGWTFAQMRAAFAAHRALRHTVADLDDAAIMTALGLEGLHPEGRFFPDTYRFAAGTTDLELFRLAQQQLQMRLDRYWQERKPDTPLQSSYEALILASIVEKESALPAERPLIAGVYVSRLRLGMRLQSDPTVIYGLGDRYDGDIRTVDLRTDTPYNTYTRAGLPPTPIALPGDGALRAVAQPNETGALFFVATGLPDGSHEFNKDYAGHKRAVARMLERQRASAVQSTRQGSR